MSKSKLSWIISITLLSAFMFAGCSNNKEEAQKAAEAYKTKEFTVDHIPSSPLSLEEMTQRNEDMKHYFAHTYEEKPDNARKTTMPLLASEIHQATLTPENIKFEVYQELNGDYMDLDYTMDIVMKKKSGENQTVPMEGRLSLVLKDQKWLIQADTFDVKAYEVLIPQKTETK